MNITEDELKEDGVKRRLDAYYPPKVPNLAIRIFNYFMAMQKYTLNAGGMSHHIMGLDQWKIGEIGLRDYNIELSRYIEPFKLFEHKLLERQSKLLERNK